VRYEAKKPMSRKIPPMIHGFRTAVKSSAGCASEIGPSCFAPTERNVSPTEAVRVTIARIR